MVAKCHKQSFKMSSNNKKNCSFIFCKIVHHIFERTFICQRWSREQRSTKCSGMCKPTSTWGHRVDIYVVIDLWQAYSWILLHSEHNVSCKQILSCQSMPRFGTAVATPLHIVFKMVCNIIVARPEDNSFF